MSYLSWNCRRLANPCVVCMLSDLVRERRPDFFFLTESIYDVDHINELNKILGYAGSFVVPCNGHNAGLAFLFKHDVSAQLLGKAHHFINVEIRLERESTYRLIGYYRHANRNHGNLSWTLLRKLVVRYTLPWCIIGDFNDLMSTLEKKGSYSSSSTSFPGFSKGYRGLWVTGSQVHWESVHLGETQRHSRLGGVAVGSSLSYRRRG